jgi:hypothetical protein
MSVRGFSICVLITLLAVLAALVAILRHDNHGFDQNIGKPVFSALAANPQAVKRLDLRHHKGGFSFTRGQTFWQSDDTFNYPASARRVDGLINDLAELRLAEPKTQRPDRYARIGVQPIEAANARGARLRLYDAQDQLIVDAIIGDRISRPTGDAKAGTFLRLTDQKQAWLASGAITLPLSLRPWLQSSVINLVPATVAQIEIIDQRGQRRLRRKTAMHSFTITSAGDASKKPIPAGRQVVDQLLTALQPLRFSDVRRRQTEPVFRAIAVVKIQRFDGLILTIHIADEDGIAWIQLEAERLPGITSDALTREIAALQSRFQPWTFQIADWINDRLTEPLDRLRQKP